MSDLVRLPRMEVQVKQLVFRFYSTHENHYKSSFQMFLAGNCGYIDTLNGNNFFVHFEEFYREMFLIPCVRYIYFEMMQDTLRLLRLSAKDLVIIEELPSDDTAGRDLIPIRMSLKHDNWDERKKQSPLPKVLAVYGDKIYEL